jgi:beta-carotene ketolase (CrtW type)
MNRDEQILIPSHQGVLVGIIIILAWAGSLLALLSIRLANFPIFSILPVMLVQTFLYTGLFITAHDAMHGIVAQKNRRLNNFIGALCVRLYALFSFTRLLAEHRQHHAHPGTDDDPDYHDGVHRNFWRWYLHFISTYVTWRQILGMALAFNVLEHILNVPSLNLALFWVMPSLLSTLQLFYFGTYLPHREPAAGYADRHRARSNDFSTFWSFVTCYHFGYHWEHHEYPRVPWWKLPAVRRKLSDR